MSFELDSIENELDTKELLKLILIELKLIRLHHEVITGQNLKPEDVSSED